MAADAGVDVERALLGSLIIDGSSIERVAGVVAEDDFASGRHRLIYAAMLALRARGTPVDWVTVVDELEHAGGVAAIGGKWVLTALINCAPTSLHVEHYARLVHEAGEARRGPPVAPAAAKQSIAELLGL